jgi:hypothetical protein
LLSLFNCKHLTPAGLPVAIPGIAEDMDRAIQQAPQPALHCILSLLSLKNKLSLYYFAKLCHLPAFILKKEITQHFAGLFNHINAVHGLDFAAPHTHSYV